MSGNALQRHKKQANLGVPRDVGRVNPGTKQSSTEKERSMSHDRHTATAWEFQHIGDLARKLIAAAEAKRAADEVAE